MDVSGVSSGSTAALVLSQRDVFVVILFLVFVSLTVILQPWLLSRRHLKRDDSSEIKEPNDPNKLSKPKRSNSSRSFFEIPYITWFLIHNGIIALAMITILILGLDGVIDKTTVSALLGSLFGYVLGSSSRSAQSPDPSSKNGRALGSSKTGTTPSDQPPESMELDRLNSSSPFVPMHEFAEKSEEGDEQGAY
ncbi:hypothetical protein GALL_395590 [mine drainage metagenome]|uniref:Uncharacterized protein n=1 Tax=mine drainage metagenome TaxID=410659 RepID=A0A1J5QS32_9ZZZZ